MTISVFFIVASYLLLGILDIFLQWTINNRVNSTLSVLLLFILIHYFIRLGKQGIYGKRFFGIKTGNTQAHREFIGALCLEVMVIQDLLEAVNQFLGRGLDVVHCQNDEFITSKTCDDI